MANNSQSQSDSNTGYGAGKSGASSSDNPHTTGVIERTVGIIEAVVTGTLSDPNRTADERSSNWESGRSAGEADSKRK